LPKSASRDRLVIDRRLMADDNRAVFGGAQP